MEDSSLLCLFPLHLKFGDLLSNRVDEKLTGNAGLDLLVHSGDVWERHSCLLLGEVQA